MRSGPYEGRKVKWWQRFREAIGDSKETLGGFYTLRHLGATEYWSRKGCSIVAMKQFLGHSAVSQMADRYMKPVATEHRRLIEWVRGQLLS
jgi:integrase